MTYCIAILILCWSFLNIVIIKRFFCLALFVININNVINTVYIVHLFVAILVCNIVLLSVLCPFSGVVVFSNYC